MTTSHRAPDPLAALKQGALESLIESVGAYAFLVDVQAAEGFGYVAVNKRLERALGRRPSGLERLPDALFPPAVERRMKVHYQRCVDAATCTEWEDELTLGDGMRWWRISLLPLLDERDRVARILGTATDITERKRTDRALEGDRKWLIDAIESINEGFALWDPVDRLVLCNSQYKGFYWTIASLLKPGASFERLMRAAIASGQFQIEGSVHDWIQSRLQARATRDGVYEEHLSDGRWLLTTERRTSDGGVVCVQTDITQRKRAERILRQSRATFQAMIDAVDEMIAMISGDGIILAINRFGARRFGLPPNGVVGRSLAELFDGDESKSLYRLINGVFATGGRVQAEFHWRERCLDVSAHPVTDHDGKPIAVSIFSRDITERKRTEESLRTLTRAVEQSPTIVVITDARGVIEYANPRFAEVTGWNVDEVVGRAPQLFESAEISEEDHQRIWTTLKAGGLWRGQFRNRRRDGSLYWAAASISPVKNAQGITTHFIVLQDDITDRVAAEEEVREHQQQLMRYMRIAAMGEMGAALAHELNQPISAVANYCHGSLRRLAAGNWTVDELAEALKEAYDEARRASEIVQNVARFVRKAPQQRVSASINAIVRSVIDLARPDLERNGIQLVLDLDDRLEPVTVNVVELEQTILNLVRNSIESMIEVETGRRRLTVRSSAANGGDIQVSVHDSGKGLSADAVERAFDPFFTTKPEGMGMGLAICRTIIAGHGGRIWAEPNADGGTSVHFTLNVGKVQHAAA